MKCINCGKHTQTKIVCPNCMNVDRHISYLTAHVCRSFRQAEDGVAGSCANFLMCEPIKKAPKNEPLIESNLGHVACPHAGVNLGKIVYGEFTEEELRKNYLECIE